MQVDFKTLKEHVLCARTRYTNSPLDSREFCAKANAKPQPEIEINSRFGIRTTRAAPDLRTEKHPLPKEGRYP